MRITSGKTQINLFDFLGLVFIAALLTSMGWEAAYQSRYKKDIAPIKAELAVSRSEVNYWQNKYDISQFEIKACRQVLKEEITWRDEKIKQIDNFLKEHKRARKYFE